MPQHINNSAITPKDVIASREYLLSTGITRCGGFKDLHAITANIDDATQAITIHVLAPMGYGPETINHATGRAQTQKNIIALSKLRWPNTTAEVIIPARASYW
jgi:hypothetical protein